jgi:hypothetical protein
MAIIPSSRYPGQTGAPSAAYPQGSAQNISSPGDGTGTPWEADLVNDWFGFFQSLLDGAGITPSGVPDQVGASDYYNAVGTLVGTGPYSTDGGTTFRDNFDRWNDFVNVKDYGATGDGVTNDTAAIQAAANTNKPLYFPSGTYKIDGTVTCNSSLFSHGQAAILINGGATDTAAFSYTSINNFEIAGLFFRVEAATSRYPIFLTGCSKFKIINNIQAGVGVSGTTKARFVRVVSGSQGIIHGNNISLAGIDWGAIVLVDTQDVLIGNNHFIGASATHTAVFLTGTTTTRISIFNNDFIVLSPLNIPLAAAGILVSFRNNDVSNAASSSIAAALGDGSLISGNIVGSGYNVSSSTPTFSIRFGTDKIYLQGTSTSIETLNIIGLSTIPEGYELTVVADTVATTVVHGTGNILLSNDANRLLRVGEALKLVRVGSAWREIGGDNYFTAGFLEVGQGRPVAGDAYVDFHGTTGADFDARFIRGSGANGDLVLLNKGTGVTEINNFGGAGAGQGTRVQGFRGGAVTGGFVGESFQINSAGSFVAPVSYGLAVAQALTPGIWLLCGTYDFQNTTGATQSVWATVHNIPTDNNACLYYNTNLANGTRVIGDIGTVIISLAAPATWGIYVQSTGGVTANNTYIYIKATRIA